LPDVADAEQRTQKHAEKRPYEEDEDDHDGPPSHRYMSKC
jgi:hypothetical protein